jgi:hypothetical protein
LSAFVLGELRHVEDFSRLDSAFLFLFFPSALVAVEEFQPPCIQGFSFCFVLSARVAIEFQPPWIQRLSFWFVLSALVAVEEFQLPGFCVSRSVLL